MALFMTTNNITNQARHIANAAAADEPERREQREKNFVRRELLSLYESNPVAVTATKDYVVSFHGHFPCEMEIKVRLYGNMSHTDEHGVTLPATTSSVEAVMAEELGACSVAVELQGARDVGTHVIAVGIVAEQHAEPAFFRSVDVKPNAGEREALQDRPADVVDVDADCHDLAASSMPQLKPSAAQSAVDLLLMDCNFFCPVYREFPANEMIDAVYYAHPYQQGTFIVSESVPVTAKVTKRKKTAQVFQIVAESGTYKWSMWASKESLHSYDELLRISCPKCLARPFPPDIDFQHAQRGLEKLNHWLQDLLSVASSSKSPVTYAMLNVPPKYVRTGTADVEESRDVLEEITDALFPGRTEVAPEEMRSAFASLFEPILSAKNFAQFLPELESGDAPLPMTEVQAILMSTIEAWIADVDADSGSVSKEKLNEQLRRHYGWKAKLHKRSFLKHFDAMLRNFDARGDGALSADEMLPLLLQYATGDHSS